KPTTSAGLTRREVHHAAWRRGGRLVARDARTTTERRRLVRPTRMPTPTATARVISRRCSTSLEMRRNASVPTLATSFRSFPASSANGLGPARQPSVYLVKRGDKALGGCSLTAPVRRRGPAEALPELLKPPFDFTEIGGHRTGIPGLTKHGASPRNQSKKWLL